MPTKLERIKVTGLHGRRQYIDIPITDNRLVLVGENGSGKSTIANLTYYLLTQQWHKLAEYRFEAIEVWANLETIMFSHEDVESLIAYNNSRFGRDFFARHSPSVRHELTFLVSQLSLFDEDEPMLAKQLAERTGVAFTTARRLLQDFRETEPLRLKKVKKSVVQAVKQLDTLDFGQFLYLPTYRRIEQDLKSIFRGIEIEEKVKEFRDRFRRPDRSSYIELIEFGMEDVEKTISSRMSQIKDDVRTGLSTLTGTYLRDVLRGLQDNPDVTALRNIAPQAFASMFARLDDSILPSVDKMLLQQKIERMTAENTIGTDDRVIAHFLSKLVSLYRQQQLNESDVRAFVDICNAYLAAKHLVYDETNYDVHIRQMFLDKAESSPVDVKPQEGHELLKLKMLSSGEKQIVSLFSHIYLSGQPNFFVVIDEPELSLSVPWQQRFLPDILRTGRCTGLIAVTHSPFIWDNELEPYVKPLAEFIHSYS